MNGFSDLLDFAKDVLGLFTDFAKNVVNWLLTDFSLLSFEGNIIEFLFGVGVPILLSYLLIKGIFKVALLG